MRQRPSRQNGMTLISFLVVFIVCGFLVLLGLKLAPVYLEYFKVSSSLSSLKKEAGLSDKSPREIISMVQKRWDINSVDRITADKSLEIEKHGDVFKIRLNYEVEEHIIGNVSALVKFDETFMLGGGSGSY